MRIFPPITATTTAYTFDPAPPNGGRRLKYLRVKSAAGSATAYMGPYLEQNSVDILHVTLDANKTRIKLSDYDITLNGGTDPEPTAGSFVQPGWLITNGSDAGVAVKRVYDGYVEFDSTLSAYADDYISLSAPFAADVINGFPLVAGEFYEFTDMDTLRGPIQFATGSGSATLNIIFELT